MKLRTIALVRLIRLLWHFKRLSRLNPRGLGYCLQGLSEPFTFQVRKRRFAFKPRCARAFGYLPCGEWNEPETHALFRKLMQSGDRSVTFIDVGASVGEMAVDAACLPGVARVMAFEPQRVCADAIQPSVRLNQGSPVEVRQAALGRRSGTVDLAVDLARPTAASTRESVGAISAVPISTLDIECAGLSGQVLLLMDVEGAELDVMYGGRQLIQRVRPLIILEFNSLSRRFFSLADVREELGSDYEILRLRGDGTLDGVLENTWNCVAIPRDSQWAHRCESIRK